jgi:integrase/recombinase XerD
LWLWLQEDGHGDLFSLSWELGHSDIKTTQKYLKSFNSDNARKHHNEFSPLRRLRVRTYRKGKKKPEK